jgi:hypothetical protein
MAQHLAQLPNYTCHQVVDRFIRRASSGGLSRFDRQEVEVAFVGNRELFARPGDERFEEQSISKLIPVGTIGNGAFGSHANSLFSDDIATFEYEGPSKKDGHKTFRYNFRVPQEKSHFLIKHDSAQGIVGYKGSFWVDEETLDLVRLELKVDRIPSHIGVSMVQETMRYQMVKIHDSEFWLPRKAELAATDSTGNYSLDIITLENCREYSGQSVVTFDAPVPKSGEASREAPEATKPQEP